MREVDGEELQWWIEYDQISPIGYERHDINAASIAHVIASASPYFQHITLSDFLHDYWKQPELTPEQAEDRDLLIMAKVNLFFNQLKAYSQSQSQAA